MYGRRNALGTVIWLAFIAMIIGPLIVAVFALVLAIPVLLLWNWLMPAIFGLGAITYWEAWGIVLLVSILFGGITSAKSSD